MSAVKIPFYRMNTNPGFRVGDLLIWDDDVVSKEKQPRCIMGVVIGFWHNGCIVDTKLHPGAPAECASYEFLCHVCLVEKVNE